ncbi:MAG TPA: hypothetical protein VFS37_14175 [Conexibacter sp.]|nr:hypothetical protein [Conexibacter sp.]
MLPELPTATHPGPELQASPRRTLVVGSLEIDCCVHVGFPRISPIVVSLLSASVDQPTARQAVRHDTPSSTVNVAPALVTAASSAHPTALFQYCAIGVHLPALR